MNELSELVLIIDTREQSQERIHSVKDWFLSHGGEVERVKLDHCDYHIEGVFRDQEINLGIEAKSLSDFSGSYRDLPHKLARAYQHYDDVGLFIESGCYTYYPDSDDFHSTINNPKVRDGSANILKLAVLENLIASLQTDNIHVRQLLSASCFPYTLANLLVYLSMPKNHRLHIKDNTHNSHLHNILAQFPKVGHKSTQSIINQYGSLHAFITASEQELQDSLGPITGGNIYSFIHSHGGEQNVGASLPLRNYLPLDKISSHAEGSNPIPPPIPSADTSNQPLDPNTRPLDVKTQELLKGSSDTALSPGSKNLTVLLREWFKDEHSLNGTVSHFNQWQSGYVHDKIKLMEQANLLRAKESNGVQSWRRIK